MLNKAVFLDRDGTINVNVAYLDNPQKFSMYPGVGEGISLLRQHGFKIIVITNQSGLARGYFTEETLKQIHDRMKKELLLKGAIIDAIYYCPHHPDDMCLCRKPRTGMFEHAINEFNIDIKKSFMIGDRMLDVEAGFKIGCNTVLIPENIEKVNREIKKSNYKADFIAENFFEGVSYIIKTVVCRPKRSLNYEG